VGADRVHGRDVVSQPLHTPRSVNWNIEVDREWLKKLLCSDWLSATPDRLRAGAESDHVGGVAARSSSSPPTADPSYREAQITARYQFHRYRSNRRLLHPVVGGGVI